MLILLISVFSGLLVNSILYFQQLLEFGQHNIIEVLSCLFEPALLVLSFHSFLFIDKFRPSTV